MPRGARTVRGSVRVSAAVDMPVLYAATMKADRGLLLGDGLFETLLLRAGRPERLDAHLARLRSSGETLGVPVPPDLGTFVEEALPPLWTREGRPARAALRVVVTRGAWEGLDPAPGAVPGVHVVVRALPDGPPPPAAAATVDAPRIDPRHPLAGHKVLSWMSYVEARRRARAAGAEMALLRTLAGDVAEADCGNLFVVIDGVAVTPPLDTGVLPGILRTAALAALRGGGRPCAERRIAPEEMERASEAFVTSSLSGARPLGRIDGREARAPGPVAAWLAGCGLGG